MAGPTLNSINQTHLGAAPAPRTGSTGFTTADKAILGLGLPIFAAAAAPEALVATGGALAARLAGSNVATMATQTPSGPAIASSGINTGKRVVGAVNHAATGSPTVTGTSTTTGSGGGGGYGGSGTGGAGTATADPYAAWGGTAAYQNLLQNYMDQDANVHSTAGIAADTQGLGIKNNILDFIDQLRADQQKVDNEGIQAELAKRQGTSAAMASVGRGIRSGATTLANMNATGSSAEGELAKAYAQLGQRDIQQVGNQYGLAENQIGQDQNNVNVERAAGTRRLSDSKTQVINTIISDANDKLAQIDGQMAYASLPDRLDMEAEKNAIKQDVMGRLQQYDALLANESGKVNAMAAPDLVAKANSLFQAGTGADNPFQFTNTPPATVGNGPLAGELPLFTLPSTKKQQNQ